MKYERYISTLENLREQGNYRSFPETNGNLIELSSNDYLGLNKDYTLYADFVEEFKANKYKLSACSSRLLSGNAPEYTQLEKLISTAYQTEDCLLYNSGYHANVGILSALAGKKDLILADKLVHASLIDGIQLSDATFMRYKHVDYKHLESLLEKHRNEYEEVFIVSESIFSMDGDIAELHKLVELKKKYNCFLYIDEAHALGVRGKNGLGCVEEDGVIQDVDFIVGTFGKALASVGAFVACSQLFKEYLVNHSRTLIFTTALPPINLAWTAYLFERLPDFNDRRIHLSELSKAFAKHLNVKAESHIVPYIIGSNQEAIEASKLLIKNDFNVLPIRYPTVPQNTARLRFSLSADLKLETLKLIKDLLKK
ncbi:MAG: 8-amino-7-oxononanoate synthase [Paludibacteraceae bacterium]|nr:8-amino-7-oxononanoate synthase [Paludibacteraceae bacterium]MBN2788027.1 8-amino-7-oxononanoate synthase [Paludibacteraceae bacterium]